MIQQGFERVSLERHRQWRWWVMIDEPFPQVFHRPAGKGREVPGAFLFARGGRASSEAEAQGEIDAAIHIARNELEELLRFRPTHALAPDGSLVPLGGPSVELPAAPDYDPD